MRIITYIGTNFVKNKLRQISRAILHVHVLFVVFTEKELNELLDELIDAVSNFVISTSPACFRDCNVLLRISPLHDLHPHKYPLIFLGGEKQL